MSQPMSDMLAENSCYLAIHFLQEQFTSSLFSYPQKNWGWGGWKEGGLTRKGFKSRGGGNFSWGTIVGEISQAEKLQFTKQCVAKPAISDADHLF